MFVVMRKMYDWVLDKSAHKSAVLYLAIIAFAESSFFLVPPDVMLIPMCLSRRLRSLYYAAICTLGSVLGGVFGYIIGMFLFEVIGKQIVAFYQLEAEFERIQLYFRDYGVWFVIVAGFTPIPYKVFTIAAGLCQMPLVPFIVASIFGRGGRFFLVCGLIYWLGERVRDFIDKYFNILTIVFTFLLVGCFILIKYL